MAYPNDLVTHKLYGNARTLQGNSDIVNLKEVIYVIVDTLISSMRYCVQNLQTFSLGIKSFKNIFQRKGRFSSVFLHFGYSFSTIYTS